MAITTGDAVPGEVIEAAWGDAVRADLTMLDNKDTTNYNLLNAAKVNKAGDTITPGLLNVGAAGSATQPGGTYGAGAVVLGLDTNARNITIYKIGSPAADTGSPYMGFYRGATAVGTITVASATSVAYNTTSDPRTKTPPGATGRGIDDAAARAQQLGRTAWRGQHIDPETGEPEGGDTWDFLSSHDIEDVAPYAVFGERDATDDDGPVWQQVSYPDLVPLLFAALSQALDRIDALEAQL